ncbi:MAG TPA: hypothetical protein DCP97_00355, partial [Ruminococcaceae bacterium]|nr:hypothetical protein [Oscillospiraceae bacterium]
EKQVSMRLFEGFEQKIQGSRFYIAKQLPAQNLRLQIRQPDGSLCFFNGRLKLQFLYNDDI